MDKKYEEKLLEKIKIRGLCKSTTQSYLNAIHQFTKFSDKACGELDISEAKKHLVFLRDVKKLAARSVNARRAAIVFYLRHVLGQRIDPGILPQMKTPITIPVVLTKEEIALMVNSLHNVFYKTVLIGLYSTGLRVSELADLKVTDVDSKEMVINVWNGKGNKDRKALLSPIFLKYLRLYWQKFRVGQKYQSEYLFASSRPTPKSRARSGKLCSQTFCYIVKLAAKNAGIKKKSIHTLLDTHLLPTF